MSLLTMSCNVPIVSCIIEKFFHGEKHILIQTRWKPWTPYHNTLEIVAWWIETYENVYDALKREVKEETGLNVTAIYPKENVISLWYHNDRAQCFQSFCCQQQLFGNDTLPRIWFCFVAQVEQWEALFQQSETRNPHWISIDKLSDMLAHNPEVFFTLQLPFLIYYTKNHDRIDRTS